MTSSEPDEGWLIGECGKLPLNCRAVTARPDSSGFVAGTPRDSMGSGLEAAVFHVSSLGEPRELFRRSGMALDVHQADGVVALLVSTDGPVFHLHLSSDDGESWSDAIATSASSLRSVCCIGGEVWAIGSETVGRWRDGVWEGLPQPTPINSRKCSLHSVAGTTVLATPEGLFIWREKERRWGRRAVEGAEVCGFQFPYVIGRHRGAVRVGELEKAWVNWMGAVEGNGGVVGFSWGTWEGGESKALQVLMSQSGVPQFGALTLLHSRPEGGFASRTLPLSPDGRNVGIAGATGLLGVMANGSTIQRVVASRPGAN